MIETYIKAVNIVVTYYVKGVHVKDIINSNIDYLESLQIYF